MKEISLRGQEMLSVVVLFAWLLLALTLFNGFEYVSVKWTPKECYLL